MNSAGNTANNEDAFPFHGAVHITWPKVRQGLSYRTDRGNLAAMSRELINSICAALPGAEVSDPWGGGHDAWKVGGKMFAAMGTIDDGVSVKTPDIETAQMLIEAGVAVKAPYFHRSWVRLPVDTAEDELRHRIESSYARVRSGLTKKAQAALPPFG